MNRAIAAATITITLVRRWAPLALAMASMATACFYPPTQKPPAPSKNEVILAQPYDLVWDAVHNVIRENKLRVNADDPNQGIVETETNRFTLDDADCGKLKGVSGKYAAEPDRAATVVYYFKVKSPHLRQAGELGEPRELRCEATAQTTNRPNLHDRALFPDGPGIGLDRNPQALHAIRGKACVRRLVHGRSSDGRRVGGNTD